MRSLLSLDPVASLAGTRRRIVLGGAVSVALVYIAVAVGLDISPAEAPFVLLTLAVALAAMELGVGLGLLAALVALLVVIFVNLVSAEDLNPLGYLSRGGAFLIAAGLVGALADGLRKSE